MTRLVTALSVVALFCASTGSGQEPVDVILDNVHVVDIETGQVPADVVSVAIRDDRIVRVGARSQMRVTEATVVLDAGGKYVLPGFWDMHAHVLYPGAGELVFPLLIANGVTGVRDMNGPMPLDEVAALRQRIAAGEVLGPRIFAPGPLVDGPGRPPSALGDEVLPVATEEEARAAVRRLHEDGADFVKVYNRLDEELLFAILDEASRIDLPVAGHVPHTVAAGAASDAGVRSIEHLHGLLEDSSAAGDRLREEMARGMELMLAGERPPPELVASIRAHRLAIVDEYDSTRARRLFARLRDNGTWVTPTLVSNRGQLIAPGDPAFARDPRLEYLPSGSTEGWFGDAPDAEATAAARRKFARLMELVKALDQVGVPLLAGTDLGVPHVFPGFSIHDELALLVEAGLDETAALRAATTAPARFLRLQDTGSVAPGQRADLVVLADNPLEDITATQRIDAVVLAGRLLPRADLDRLLDEARARARASSSPDGEE